jgi:hypothetical protein
MDSVFCICQDLNGHWWASAGDEELYTGDPSHWNRVTPVIRGVKVILSTGNGLGQAFPGRIWVGTSSGLYFSDDHPGGFRLFAGMAHHSVRALTEDQAGTLWAGSGNGDLYHITDDKVTAFRPNEGREIGAIWSVLADDDGTVWAGTFRGGLLRFRDGAFFHYGKSQGLPDDVICQILEDEHGNLWLGSHQGIFRVAKSALDNIASGKEKSVACVEYGRSDGLPSLECSGGYQPSAMRSHDGKLWFTTARGIGWIQPREIHSNPIPPRSSLKKSWWTAKSKPIFRTNKDRLCLRFRLANIRLKYIIPV